MPKKINLIFTRDFSLCTSDFWQILLSEDVKREFGIGIYKQIAHFTGRASEYYRLEEEMEALKEHVLKKSFDDVLFSEESANGFIQNILRFRALIQNNRAERLFEIMDIFRKLYPWYMLSIFIPGPWANDAEKIYAKHSKTMIQRWYTARVASEGALKELDSYFRQLILKLLMNHHLNIQYAHVLRLEEFLEAFQEGLFVQEEVLQKRLQGYILYESKLILNKELHVFFSEKEFEHHFFMEKDIQTIQGQIASLGGKSKIQATVQIILNVEEVKNFQKGNILVTSMTVPDYLSAMKNAAAIITDEGGITCHAAIVSRELKKPCVIGTKIATRVLKDGDIVEVDAEKGIVKKIN